MEITFINVGSFISTEHKRFTPYLYKSLKPSAKFHNSYLLFTLQESKSFPVPNIAQIVPIVFNMSSGLQRDFFSAVMVIWFLVMVIWFLVVQRWWWDYFPVAIQFGCWNKFHCWSEFFPWCIVLWGNCRWSVYFVFPGHYYRYIYRGTVLGVLFPGTTLNNTWHIIRKFFVPGDIMEQAGTYVLMMIHIWLVRTQKYAHVIVSLSTYVFSTSQEILLTCPRRQWPCAQPYYGLWNHLKTPETGQWQRKYGYTDHRSLLLIYSVVSLIIPPQRRKTSSWSVVSSVMTINLSICWK